MPPSVYKLTTTPPPELKSSLDGVPHKAESSLEGVPQQDRVMSLKLLPDVAEQVSLNTHELDEKKNAVLTLCTRRGESILKHAKDWC